MEIGRKVLSLNGNIFAGIGPIVFLVLFILINVRYTTNCNRRQFRMICGRKLSVENFFVGESGRKWKIYLILHLIIWINCIDGSLSRRI